MNDYNKLFMIIRKTDLLTSDEKDELHLYLMNLEEQVKKQKEVIDKAIKYINSPDISIDIRKTDGSLDYVSTNELLDILKEK